jgi:hypothetical protein
MFLKHTNVREYTKKFLYGMAEGSINSDQLAARLLQFLSESEVKEFAVGEGYFQDEDEEEEEKEELTVLELEAEGRKGKRWMKDRQT